MSVSWLAQTVPPPHPSASTLKAAMSADAQKATQETGSIVSVREHRWQRAREWEEAS